MTDPRRAREDDRDGLEKGAPNLWERNDPWSRARLAPDPESPSRALQRAWWTVLVLDVLICGATVILDGAVPQDLLGNSNLFANSCLLTAAGLLTARKPKLVLSRRPPEHAAQWSSYYARNRRASLAVALMGTVLILVVLLCGVLNLSLDAVEVPVLLVVALLTVLVFLRRERRNNRRSSDSTTPHQ